MINVKSLFLSSLQTDFYYRVKIEETGWLVIVIKYSLSFSECDKCLPNSNDPFSDSSRLSALFKKTFWPSLPNKFPKSFTRERTLNRLF